MEILIKVLQFFMSLTLLVAVHEFGHFIMARIFKIRVEKFYIFFDAGFSLWKKKWGDTEYGLGWLPLGGYCKIAGMVDESMDKEQLASAPQPWEYRAKPAWQRFDRIVPLQRHHDRYFVCALRGGQGSTSLHLRTAHSVGKGATRPAQGGAMLCED